jgi:hypothetical protein
VDAASEADGKTAGVALLPAALGCVATLPVAAEIDARLVPHRQPYSAINLGCRLHRAGDLLTMLLPA